MSYIELEIIKKDNEYKICSNFIYPKDRNISVDFYINNINELKDILDIKNTYIKLTSNDTEELKSLENEFLQNQNQSQEQNELFDLIILKKFFENHYTINIVRKDDISKINNYDTLYINDDINILLEKFFLYFHDKEFVFSNKDINLQNLNDKDEKLIKNLSFIDIDYLKLINCNINFNILKELHIESLDLSESNYFNIKTSEIEELKANIKNIIFNKPCIIIDNGSNNIKVGFNGDEGPIAVFPACVAYKKGNIYPGNNTILIGEAAEYIRGEHYRLHYPIENGFINNWDDIEEIWRYTLFEILKVNPYDDNNIILTETSMNFKESREKMAEIMFETFKVSGLYIINKVVLSLYSIGKYTGLVIDSGNSDTQIVPVFDGYSLPHAIYEINLGGEDLTKYMMDYLSSMNYYKNKNICQNIKEKTCYVALDFEEEIKSVEPFEYELPDGTHIKIKEERIKCPEALFKPQNIGKEGDGISQLCNNSIQKCDIDIRKELYNSIVLSGGNTMFNGLAERLNKEIKILTPDNMKEEVNIIANPDRKFASWLGGKNLASNPKFRSTYITRTEYEDYGNSILHRKCF